MATAGARAPVKSGTRIPLPPDRVQAERLSLHGRLPSAEPFLPRLAR